MTHMHDDLDYCWCDAANGRTCPTCGEFDRYAGTDLEHDHDTFNDYVVDVAMGRRAGEQVWPR